MTTTMETPLAKEASEPVAPKPSGAAKVSWARKPSAPLLAVGGIPRADLLPPEIRAEYRGKAVVRMLAIFVVALAFVVAGGVGFATLRSISSQQSLELERDRSLELVARQLDFAVAKQTADQVDAAIVARSLGTASEIDWRVYLDEVSATLPAGVGLTQLVIAPVVVTEDEAVIENPLQQAAVATITITATSVTVPDVEAWFDDLAGITGFAGIAPPATVAGSPTVGYIVGLQLLVNEEAYLARFQNDAGE